jgi:hypothetical protein
LGTGTAAPQGLVLLLKFPDQGPTNKTRNGTGGLDNDVTHNTAWAVDHWFDLTEPTDLADTSVSFYFKTASYGKFAFGGDAYNNTDFGGTKCDSNGWLTSAYDRADIDEYADSTTCTMIEDNIQQIDSNVDFNDYDSNDDGHRRAGGGLRRLINTGPMWTTVANITTRRRTDHRQQRI